MTARSAADVLADLAALAARQAELTAELAAALRAPAPVAAPAASPEYLTTAEAAALLGVSACHLKGLRRDGRGPRFVRVGRSVRYAREALTAAVQAPFEASLSLPSAALRPVRFR